MLTTCLYRVKRCYSFRSNCKLILLFILHLYFSAPSTLHLGLDLWMSCQGAGNQRTTFAGLTHSDQCPKLLTYATTLFTILSLPLSSLLILLFLQLFSYFSYAYIGCILLFILLFYPFLHYTYLHHNNHAPTCSAIHFPLPSPSIPFFIRDLSHNHYNNLQSNNNMNIQIQDLNILNIYPYL